MGATRSCPRAIHPTADRWYAIAAGPVRLVGLRRFLLATDAGASVAAHGWEETARNTASGVNLIRTSSRLGDDVPARTCPEPVRWQFRTAFPLFVAVMPDVC
jgi:hypothetical protein